MPRDGKLGTIFAHARMGLIFKDLWKLQRLAVPLPRSDLANPALFQAVYPSRGSNGDEHTILHKSWHFETFCSCASCSNAKCLPPKISVTETH